jgi:GMP synthase-like glutamine amidotransferase
MTIIETGLVSPHRQRHGSYPEMLERMIRAEDPSIAFDVISIPNGHALPVSDKLEAILITGSAAGVYDELDWIAPLEDFVRAAYAGKTPMVGVCFGHQLIAQAPGGVVRKSERAGASVDTFMTWCRETASSKASVSRLHARTRIRSSSRRLTHEPFCSRTSHRMQDLSTPMA